MAAMPSSIRSCGNGWRGPPSTRSRVPLQSLPMLRLSFVCPDRPCLQACSIVLRRRRRRSSRAVRGARRADAREESADDRRLHEVEEHQRAGAFRRRQVADVRHRRSRTPCTAESKPVLHLVNLQTNQDVEVADASGGNFSPDSTWIAYTVDPNAGGRGGRGGRAGGGGGGTRRRSNAPGHDHATSDSAGSHSASDIRPRLRRDRAQAPAQGRGANANVAAPAAARRAAQSRDRRDQVVAGHSVVHVLADLHPPDAAPASAAGAPVARPDARAVKATAPAAARRRGTAAAETPGGTARRGRHRAQPHDRSRSAARQRRRQSRSTRAATLLAYTVDAAVKDANGLFVLELAHGPRDSARERREALQPPDLERGRHVASRC